MTDLEAKVQNVAIEDARYEYDHAVQVLLVAKRQLRQATLDLLHALGIPLSSTTLIPKDEVRKERWLESVDDHTNVYHYPPSTRRKIRELRANQPKGKTA